MSDTTDNGTAPQGPKMGEVGEVSEQARIALQSIQQRQQTLQFQIGGLEMQKMNLLNNIELLRQQAKRILDSEGTRLGIPPGRQWHVTPEGKAVLTG